MHSILLQIGNVVVVTAGLALVFGLPAIIIRAWNTRGEKKARPKDQSKKQ